MISIRSIMRPSNFRLLASTLVILAVLCNTIVMARTYPSPLIADCCPEMPMHQMASDTADMHTMTCSDSESNSYSDCSDICMARCISANGLLSTPVMVLLEVLNAPHLPQRSVSEHSLAEFGPGLRPPINS